MWRISNNTFMPERMSRRELIIKGLQAGAGIVGVGVIGVFVNYFFEIDRERSERSREKVRKYIETLRFKVDVETTEDVISPFGSAEKKRVLYTLYTDQEPIKGGWGEHFRYDVIKARRFDETGYDGFSKDYPFVQPDHIKWDDRRLGKTMTLQ